LGGGVYVESATANVRNAIVWGNSTTWGSGETAQISVWSPMSFSLMSSCVQNWTSGGLGGSWNTANDPLLADPDGADGIPGTADDDLRLTSGSSAIDTGSNAAVPDDTFDVDRDGDTSEPLPLDLARGDRFLGTGPTVDMGAYEYLNTGDDLGDPTPPAAGAPAPEPSGTAYIAFTYDALGRRVERIVDSGGAQVEVTRYYYDGENVILETDANEAPRRSFVHGSQYIDERVLMRLPDGKEYYYLLRELYSVAALTDEIGEIVEAATYDTYGKVAVYDGAAQAVEESPVGNPYYFTGRRLDPLPTASSPQPATKQLYHYRARAYDPGNGRFLERDPAEYVDGANLYAYVLSSPASMSDPTGLHGLPHSGQPSWCPPFEPPSNYRIPKCDDCWQTCLANQHLFVGDGGGWLCRADGCRCACVNETQFPSTGRPADEALRKCAYAHEEDHVHREGWGCSCNPKPCRGGSQPGTHTDRECYASAAEINCLCSERTKCGADANCIKEINMRMKKMKDYCRRKGGNAYDYGARKCP